MSYLVRINPFIAKLRHYLSRKSRFIIWAFRVAGSGVALHSDADISLSAEIRPQGGSISVSRGVIIDKGVLLRAYGGKIVLGKNSTLGPYSCLYGGGELVIGRYVLIGPHVCIVAANHIYDLTDMPIAEQGVIAMGVTIEDDVWVGAGATILDGVVIGTGSVVGAGSVVTKSVLPYSVVAGVPAVVIKKRHPGPVIFTVPKA